MWLHGLQHSRVPCPSVSPGVCSSSRTLSWWRRPVISSSVTPLSSCPQSGPASGLGQYSGSVGCPILRCGVLLVGWHWWWKFFHCRLNTCIVCAHCAHVFGRVRAKQSYLLSINKLTRIVVNSIWWWQLVFQEVFEIKKKKNVLKEMYLLKCHCDYDLSLPLSTWIQTPKIKCMHLFLNDFFLLTSPVVFVNFYLFTIIFLKKYFF